VLMVIETRQSREMAMPHCILLQVLEQVLRTPKTQSQQRVQRFNAAVQ
jgi:hypothetical protein